MFIETSDLADGGRKNVSFTEKLAIPPEYGVASGFLDAEVSGVFVKIGDIYEFNGRVTAEAVFECARCLSPAPYSFDIAVNERYKSAQGLTREEADDVWTFSGARADITPSILTGLFLAMPLRVLCGGDCKGLCRVCGRSLNSGRCGCDTSPADIRLEGLKSFFDS